MYLGIRIDQTPMVVSKEIAAFLYRKVIGESSPCFREETAHTVHEPVDLVFSAQEYAAQDKAEAAVRVRLSVGKSKARPPGAAEHKPTVDPEVLAELFDILNQISGRVIGQLAKRCRTSGAPLVENDDAIRTWIEETAMGGNGARARSAVQEDDRHALGVAALLPIKMMEAIDGKATRFIRLDFGK